MASTSTSYGRHGRNYRRSRRTQNASPVVNLDDSARETRSAACIDLTADTSGYDVIDLTSGHSINIMDSPAVVLSPSDDIGPVRRRRGSGRRGRHRSMTRRQLTLDVDLSTSMHAQPENRSQPHVHVLLSEDSDSDDMAQHIFQVSQSGATASDSILHSPEAVKISCPVCMDDPKQIQRSGRQVVSTTCGHIFCNVCIKAAINNQHACPTCRKRLYQRNIHPLFL